MTKRIFRSIIIVALAILFACFALFLGVLYDYFSSVEKEQMRLQLAFAAEGTEKGGLDYLQNLKPGNTRLTWVDKDGRVLFDSQTKPEEMENHAQREEIRKAMESGSGESARYSATLTEQTLYFARRLNDGSVLRVSVARMTSFSLVLAMVQPICTVLLAALVLSGFLASSISKKIVQPLENINYDLPLESAAYPELEPILKRMEQQRHQIQAQQQRLREQEREFLAVTGKMSEGLVLLNKNSEILSINPAAGSFFSANCDCTGKSLLSLESGGELAETLKNAEEKGYDEVQCSRNGREYLVRVSRVEDDGGLVILIFDITDRVFAERNRREFTANVSHELKTPLQAIMGSAELLGNNLVRPEDITDFIQRIRREAERLVALIEDIIRLSRLDEKSELPMEEVELLELATNEVAALQPIAAKRQITMSVEGTPVHMQGVRQLLHEIVYNLCDNAVKYNVDGGTIRVSVGEQENGAFLQVRDTGIGIAKEHRERIFERFYRVDKSHSRASGGTGLGLSIVKHAAEYMRATIRVEGEPGEGSQFTVFFPKG